MKTLYRHYRNHWVSEENITFFNKTFAGKYDPEMRTLTIAAAVCSEKDNFSRAEGRKKSEFRLKSKNALKIDVGILSEKEIIYKFNEITKNFNKILDESYNSGIKNVNLNEMAIV